MGVGKILRLFIYLPAILIVVFWTIVGILFNSVHLEAPLFFFLKTTIMIVWSIGTFYFFYFLLIKMFLQQKRIVGFLVISIVSCFSISVIAFYFHELNKVFFDYRNIHLSLKGWGVYSLFTAIIGGLAIFYRFTIDWFINLKLREKMENLHLKSEIFQLKSKLNPHFLFNTINNIDTLIETDSKNASEYLGKLSSLLRYVIYDTEKEKVELGKELACLKDYIELQKLRIPENNKISFTIDGESSGYHIAPSLLLPFVENIFKHAGWSDNKFESKIEIRITNGILQYKSQNKMTRISINHTNTSGIGITTTKKRLELLYPNLNRLEVKIIDDTYFVDLEINLNDN